MFINQREKLAKGLLNIVVGGGARADCDGFFLEPRKNR